MHEKPALEADDRCPGSGPSRSQPLKNAMMSMTMMTVVASDFLDARNARRLPIVDDPKLLHQQQQSPDWREDSDSEETAKKMGGGGAGWNR